MSELLYISYNCSMYDLNTTKTDVVKSATLEMIEISTNPTYVRLSK